MDTLTHLKVNSSKFFFIIILFLLVCMFQNMQIWPAVYFSSKTISLSVVLAGFITFRNYFTQKLNVALLYVFSLICVYIILLDKLASIPQILPYLIGIFLFHLHDEYKQRVLLFVSKALAYIVLIGLCCYIIWLFVDFPSIGVLNSPFNYRDHNNYLFFILPVSSIFPRFSGPFVEPGHLGMISVFLVYANNFQFKTRPYLWSLLLGILFSLSLAAYILLIFAFLLHIRLKLRNILVITIAFIAINYIVTHVWAGGDNPVYELIYKRLEYDEDKGISGNNRTPAITDYYYDLIVKSGDIVFGKGSVYMGKMFHHGGIQGAGYKMFFMQFGIVGTILIFLFYAVIAHSGIDRRYAYGFLLLYMASFVQRAYPYWLAWLIPYVCAMNYINIGGIHKKNTLYVE